ncbi:MAG: hypothetical protein OXU21_13260 [Chloroflexota bacterium]|nr:hypothetical protein [Chloroflexota bacterium]
MAPLREPATVTLSPPRDVDVRPRPPTPPPVMRRPAPTCPDCAAPLRAQGLCLVCPACGFGACG